MLAFVLLAASGVLFTYNAAQAHKEYQDIQLTINLAGGENSKEMQKANDSARFVDSYKSKYTKYAVCAVISWACFAVLAAYEAFALIKKRKSKNVGE